jgi:hypothetical protein
MTARVGASYGSRERRCVHTEPDELVLRLVGSRIPDERVGKK